MDQPRPDSIPNPAVRRLSLYLRQLEAFKRKDRRTISSKQLGESLHLTDAQVRKDLAYFGQFGHPGIGYRVDDLIAQVRKILGTDKIWNVLLVGAGIRGILNFAPTSVNVPPNIALNAVDLSVQLEQLSFQVNFAGMAPTLSETGS